MTIREIVISELDKRYVLKENAIGADAHLSSKGMNFTIESYEAEGMGHLCILSMNAMLGLMKMETIVLAAEDADVPLLNLDRIAAMGKRTQLIEFYDNMLEKLADADAEAYMSILRQYDNLEEYESGEHWYDGIRYPFTFKKKKKGSIEVFDDACRRYIKEYLRQIEKAPKCDPDIKRNKTADFAGRLLAEGGPAVDQMKKLFGAETAERVVMSHMYGIDG